MNSIRWRNITTQLREQKIGIAAIAVLVLFVIAAALAFLSKYDPNQIVVLDRLKPPDSNHWFGTDDYGRDYLARALYGGRISLSVGFLSMVISVTLGMTVGTISGYFGGWVDNLLMRSVDVLMAIPSFFLMLILNAYMKPGIGTIIVIIGALSWMGIARIVRAETLSVKEREYVLYARVSGQSKIRIIIKHIIPNIMPTIIVSATINIASAILMESSLSFLGLGVKQPNSSWGSMLNDAQSFISEAPYLAIIPGVFILLTVLSFNFLGDIFRVAFEPKANKR
ncbi:ABC transporter permease [Paenibacillus macquariensis]|uniref:Peptide/nickel transport system permease protein n=1 Tax=Paenibacillus macquariensis TaxID=948756 RepID=A0ABY1JRA1_9BACL|nr:ABC transporter permease [Paenibacillus macquariensis]MEC0092718.1 ABC transporter permease [Paenibacillus macquariensis]OAB36112.1 peptide ABC transporter permease [Paenibacillus macquariensis subsp. macquariensis]SIQ64605.1 peptide/nickel transport system permease protein [Paenibacillus macquariensis]